MVSYSRRVRCVGATRVGFAATFSAMVPPGFAAGRACSEGPRSNPGSAVEFVHADPGVFLLQQTTGRLRSQFHDGGQRGALRLAETAEHPRDDVASSLGATDAHADPDEIRALQMGDQALEPVVAPVAAAHL